MATQRSDDHPVPPPEGRRWSRGESPSVSVSSRDRAKGRVHWREPVNRPPRPNHFLSVRIDSSHIWEEVSSLQDHILEKHGHLRPAAIPVQDLHVTLFVASFKEEDGSLQRAAETLRQCGDILLGLGLSPGDSDTPPYPEPQDPPAAGNTCSDHEKGSGADAGEVEDAFISGAETFGVVDGSELQMPDHEVVKSSTEALKGSTSEDTKDVLSTVAGEGCARAPLKLSFRGLGTFGNRVLFARLHEDEQAYRLRRLTHALQRRFSDAGLLGEAAPGDGDGGDKQPSRFDFTPHVTVMKTSKLKKRGVIIPPSCYKSHREAVFGSHSPVAVELSSMLEREEAPEAGDGEPRPYYKCVERLALASTDAAKPLGSLVS